MPAAMSQLMQLPEPEKSKQVHDYGLGETRHHEFFVEEPIFVEEVEAAPDSLLKVSGLEPLQEVCRQFGIDFVAHGSAVRRLLEHPRHSIFDLAPFLSDVDLIHTGSSAQTAAIESAVRKEVPFAECLRLQVRSREAATGFEIAAAHSGIIPAATPRLSTNEGLLDSWDGLRDIRSKEFRYIKNGFFHSSPLRKTGDDLDVMSVLLYLRILFESDGTPAESAIEDCRRVLAETLSSSECLKAIGKNDGLAARLAYSLYSLRTVVSVRKLASRLNLEEFDAFLTGEAPFRR